MSSGVEDVHGPLFYIPPIRLVLRGPPYTVVQGPSRRRLSVCCFFPRVSNAVSVARCGLLLTIISHYEKQVSQFG